MTAPTSLILLLLIAGLLLLYGRAALARIDAESRIEKLVEQIGEANLEKHRLTETLKQRTIIKEVPVDRIVEKIERVEVPTPPKPRGKKCPYCDAKDREAEREAYNLSRSQTAWVRKHTSPIARRR